MKHLYDISGKIVPYAIIEEKKYKFGNGTFEILTIDLELFLTNIFDINQQFISMSHVDISKNQVQYSYNRLSILLEDGTYDSVDINRYNDEDGLDCFGIEMTRLLSIIQNFKERRKYKTNNFSLIHAKSHKSTYTRRNNNFLVKNGNTIALSKEYMDNWEADAERRKYVITDKDIRRKTAELETEAFWDESRRQHQDPDSAVSKFWKHEHFTD